MSPYSGPF